MNPQNSPRSFSYLDKLAQFGTFEKPPKKRKPLSLGVKRANGKYFTRHLQNLLYYGNPDSVLSKSYLNTYFCCHAIDVIDGKEKTKYCKNRWCLPCSRIKTAVYINAYLSQITEMAAPQLITLTRRNVPGEDLKNEIGELVKFRSMLMDAEKKFRKRSGMEKTQALWKIEITYNNARDDYHPHLHAILPDDPTAKRTVSRWLSLKENKGKVSSNAQNIRPVIDDRAAKELFKYFTKLISKDRETNTYKIYPAKTLDIIFTAMRNRQVYTSYGLKKPPDVVYDSKTIDGLNLDSSFDYFFMWNQNIADWMEQSTGLLLTGNKPSELIKNIFKNE